MILRKTCLIGLALCLVSAGYAEDQTAATGEAPTVTVSPLNSGQAPQGPLLKRIPGFSAWRINFYYAKDKEKASPENTVEYGPGLDPDFLPSPLRHITLTRTKPRYLAVSVDVKGNVLEQSSDGIQEFLSNPKSGHMMNMIRDATTPLKICDFAKVDFPDLEWVSKETFKGSQKIGEIDCMVFQKEGTVAWIDARTRFPVLWKQGGETRTFKEMPAPTGMVQLSRRAQDLSEEYQKVRERVLKPRKRGG